MFGYLLESFNQRLYVLFSILNSGKSYELLMRIELTTSSLPRKCSTPELQQLVLEFVKTSLSLFKEL
jgi:hypothetical protein